MEKIRLDLDELKVDSFAVESLPEQRGTVRGEEASGICGTSKYLGCWCTEAC